MPKDYKFYRIKKFITILIVISALIFAVPANVKGAPIKDLSPRPFRSGAEIIAAINGYRQQYGLAAMSQNSLLSSLAQSQSDYQATLNTVTHTGPGGTTPQERATAAGYGSGSFFYLSEIIYGGYNQTVQDALVWWQNSSLHNSIMLNSKYTEIGAGVATNGESVYFTAVLGGPTGDSSSSGGGDTSGSTDNGNTQPTLSVPSILPIQKATPQADGSIVHTVRSGQTLWTIAAVYEIDLNKLLEINGLNQYSYVFPGDQILVRIAGQYQDAKETKITTEEAVSTAAASPTQPQNQVIGAPYSSLDQTVPPVTSTSTLAAKITEISPTAVQQNSDFFSDVPIARNLIIGAFVILILVLIGSMFIQKPASRPPKDDVIN